MRRLARSLPVVLTLSLFLGWLVVGVAHHHADQPGCELCKAMHHGIAEVARPAAAPLPRLTHETIALTAVDRTPDPSLQIHQGRAPPLA